MHSLLRSVPHGRAKPRRREGELLDNAHDTART